MNFERILTELWCEKFEWFDPSPIEPFNSGTGIIAILSMIKEDIEKEMKVASEEEADALKAYQELNADSQVTCPLPSAKNEGWTFLAAIFGNLR